MHVLLVVAGVTVGLCFLIKSGSHRSGPAVKVRVGMFYWMD